MNESRVSKKLPLWLIYLNDTKHKNVFYTSEFLISVKENIFLFLVVVRKQSILCSSGWILFAMDMQIVFDTLIS